MPKLRRRGYRLATCALALLLGPTLVANASTPASQDVTVPTVAGEVVVIEWTGNSPRGVSGQNGTCPTYGRSDPTEDGHFINLTVPTGAYSKVRVSAQFHIEWNNNNSDLVLTLEKDGQHVADSDEINPPSEENLSLTNPFAGSYEAVVCPWLSQGTPPYTGRLTLTAVAKGAASIDGDSDGVLNEDDECPETAAGTAVGADGCPPATATGLKPRYQIHVAPAALGNDAGEPSVGFNPSSKRTMFISYVTALRQTYAELSDRKDAAGDPLPAACDAAWEDKSGTLTQINSLDPILFTDQATGRTFNSQLSGDNSLMEYTDDDGENWTPAQAGPPNGGADHQTVATGVYPAGSVPPSARWPATGSKRAVYYCSQSVASAFCSRSDDGGTTFGPGIPVKNSGCSAGALHGHVKVAPDGTVYVPDSSQCLQPLGPLGETARHVFAFVSTDAGATWAARPVPDSRGGYDWDPSIGIATDNTVYMCYGNPDSSVHVAVSHDRGQTWTSSGNLGAPLGVLQTAFPQMIAGDPDRASCAFLGTTTAGNSASLDFKGVWYPYQATTFDGGASWHLVNVSPHDPVQGYGGISFGGTNRNLLDFNDLQVDDQGRTLFAYADGCIGACVQDPGSNTFAAKATIARQSGGRTLFAAFDDKAQTQYNSQALLKPAAACANQDASARTVVQSNVVWNAPDNGGTPVTDYRVFRALAPAGPFTLLGSTGKRRSYTDTTVKPSVEKYFYRVEAENSVGIAPLSNIIELAVSALPADPCTIPGEIISQDSEGDGGADDTDIIFLGVAEPPDYADDFVITMKVANFTTGMPPSGSFYVIMFPQLANLYIALNATSGPPAFEYGTFAEDPAGEGLLTFSKAGNLDPRSKFAADGTITLVVPRALFGDPAPGDVIPGFDARTRVGSQSATSRDTAGNVDYTVRGIEVCALPGTVIADLTASATEGKIPFTVEFAVSGAQSKGRALDTWSLLFGDETGDPPVPTTGSFGGAASVAVSHTYAAEGTYRARLTVTDEDGQSSQNLAEETISALTNLRPVANAGPDQAVDEGSTVTLDGSGSVEPDGAALQYEWTYVQAPGGPDVTLTGADPARPQFTAPQVDVETLLNFQLVVRDPEGLEQEDSVVVTVRDVAVEPPPPPPPPVTITGETRILGGALPRIDLVLLSLLLVLRRRGPAGRVPGGIRPPNG